MELNPFSYEFHEDPYPTYRWLRDHAPLYHNAELDFYALSRFRDVLAGLQDWKTYSSAEGTTVERMDARMFDVTPMMIFMDPPRHDRLRKLVSSVFTPRRIANLEPFIRATAVRLLDALVERGGGDFVKDFSTPLPMEVIFTMLGVPDADRRQLRHWMDVSLDRDRDTPALPARALDAMMNLVRYWFQLLTELRRAPNDGLISGLLDAEVETDDGGTTKLTDGEIAGFCALLGAAGNETVTKLLADAAVLFARNPDEYAKILDRPAADSQRRRRSAALRLTGAVSRPHGHRAMSSGTARRFPRARASCCSTPRRTATSASSPTPTASTSIVSRRWRWDSATACTSVSARRWRAWRAASPSKSSRAASRATRSTRAAASACT